jgi:hypothetical protein
MTQLESGQQAEEEAPAKIGDQAERHAEVERLAVAAVDRAVEEDRRRGFTITKFGRHPEFGYFHARVTPSGGVPVYVHRRFGSWMAPGTINGHPVLKEVNYEVKVALQTKARAVEKAERVASGKEDENGQPNGDTDGPGSGGAEPGPDVNGETAE